MRKMLTALADNRITRHHRGIYHVDRWDDGREVTETSLIRAMACGFVEYGTRDGDVTRLGITPAGRDCLAREP